MSEAITFFGYLALVAVCGFYADEIGDRLWKPKDRLPSREWRDMVEPIVKKCKLSATFGGSTIFNPGGLKALADLLEKMARELDAASK